METVRSTAPGVTGAGISFRGYNYTEICVKLCEDGSENYLRLDTGYGMSCIDRQLLLNTCIMNLHKIRGIGDKVHISSEYAVLTILPTYGSGNMTSGCGGDPV